MAPALSARTNTSAPLSGQACAGGAAIAVSNTETDGALREKAKVAEITGLVDLVG